MSDHITILDGGMGRHLHLMGAPFGSPEWSAKALIDAPDYVLQAHLDFIAAGAEVITTNAYAVVPFHIGEERFKKSGRALIRLSAQLARQAVTQSNHPVRVAGCLPPVFGSYRPDLFSRDKALDLLLPLIEEQNDDIDFWLAETISSIEEAVTILEALKSNPKPVWLSFTLKDREGHDEPAQLRSGEYLTDILPKIAGFPCDAVLFNCSQPEEMLPALDVAVPALKEKKQIGVYANTFPPIKKGHDASLDTEELRKELTPDVYYDLALKWKSAGATIIGGCCGIEPRHIQALLTLNT